MNVDRDKGNWNCVLFADPLDPDNLALLRASQNIFGYDRTRDLVLTDTPNGKGRSNGEFIPKELAFDLLIAAIRIHVYNFKGTNVPLNLYDGGVAANSPISPEKHFEGYRRTSLDPQSLKGFSTMDAAVKKRDELGRKLLEDSVDAITLLVGGPMTGLAKLIEEFPSVATKIDVLYATFGYLGSAQFMAGGPYNVIADPESGEYVLERLTRHNVPIFLIPTEVTKDKRIAFGSPKELKEHLKDTESNCELIRIYDDWFFEGLFQLSHLGEGNQQDYGLIKEWFYTLDSEQRRQIAPIFPYIFLYDVAVPFAASSKGSSIYHFERGEISFVPGKMGLINPGDGPIHVATELKSPQEYMKCLQLYLQ